MSYSELDGISGFLSKMCNAIDQGVLHKKDIYSIFRLLENKMDVVTNAAQTPVMATSFKKKLIFRKRESGKTLLKFDGRLQWTVFLSLVVLWMGSGQFDYLF